MKARLIIVIIAILLTISSVMVAAVYTSNSPFAHSGTAMTPSYSMQSTSAMLSANTTSYSGTVYAVGASSPNYSPIRRVSGDPDPDYDPEDANYEPGTPTELSKQLPIGDGTGILVFFAMLYVLAKAIRGRMRVKN